MNQPLIPGIDYTIDEQGRWVFTREFHLKRGVCCGSACVNCPYEHENVPERRRDGGASAAAPDDAARRGD